MKISDIRINGGTQPREAINHEVVAEYSDALNNGAEFPPIIVFHDGSEYWLADGFHRIEAYKKSERKEIPTEVKQGTRRDAILYSAGANSDHGLRRTNADKRRAVLALLNDEEWQTWSNREIARKCSVDETLVRKMRPEVTAVKPQSEEPTERTYTTKHGTTATMNTGNIGRGYNNNEASEDDDEPLHPREWATEDDLIRAGKEVFEREYEKNKKKKEKQEIIEQSNFIESLEIKAETKTRKVKPGDVIKLGQHTLMCNDSYALDIQADALITDPPYGINYEPQWLKWDGSPSEFRRIAGDVDPFDPSQFLKYKTMLFFGANYYSSTLPLGGWLVWDKRLDEKKDAMFGSPFELAWFISNNTKRRSIIKRVLHGGVVNADSKFGNNESRVHPTQKPIALFSEIIHDLTHKGDTVYDPFAGSGTTLLAADITERKCIAVEIDSEYCDIIISRWEKRTGEVAIWQE